MPARLALPGSNLTNLIVLGHLRLSGGAFFARMVVPTLGAAAVTALVVAGVHRRAFSVALGPSSRPDRPVLGVGLLAVAAVTVLVVILRAPAVPVAIVGAAAVAVRALRSGPGPSPRAAVRILGLPVLVGLFLLAVALGTLGRTWAGPATLLGHLGAWGAAATGAVCSVLVNNLPAASLLAAHRPPHPFALLIGLNVGPNLCVTGSLAWILWLRAARCRRGPRRRPSHAARAAERATGRHRGGRPAGVQPCMVIRSVRTTTRIRVSSSLRKG